MMNPSSHSSSPWELSPSPIPPVSPPSSDFDEVPIAEMPSFGSPHEVLGVHRRPAALPVTTKPQATTTQNQTRQPFALVEPAPTIVQVLKGLITPTFIMRGLLMFTTFTILLLPFFYLLEDILTPHSPPTPSRDVFCSSPPWSSEVLPLLPAYQNGCFSCPPHGKCRGGKLECEDGYFQVYHECVARSEHTLAGYTMKERLLSELASHAGRRVCGDTSSLGAPLPDLTTRELQEYVRPFHPTPEQHAQFERAWAFAHTWLNAEGVLLQNFRLEKDYQTRLLIVNLDSKQPVRYRARYPTKSFTCRLRESTSAHLTAIIILGTIFSIIAHIILFVRMYAKWYSRSSKVYDEMVHKIREDYFIDYDHGGVITQQPQNIFELKEEFLTSTSSSSEDVLLDQLIWPRVQRLMYSNPSIELGSHTFQYGPSPSWIWRGAVSRSAVKELERVRNPYAADTLESVQL